MSTQKVAEVKTDKVTEISFYLMAFALGAGFLVAIGFLVYALFF